MSMSISSIGNTCTGVSNSASCDLHRMTIDQIRAQTTELCCEGKLDPMQQAVANLSGWLGTGSDGTLGHGSNYSSSGIAAVPSFGQTYDIVSTLQQAAALERAHANPAGADEYEKMLAAFEDLSAA